MPEILQIILLTVFLLIVGPATLAGLGALLAAVTVLAGRGWQGPRL